MTNSKKTKRTLLYSGIALILCFTMLLGTTFAWFTDTASTAVNKIQAGTLDIELLDKEGNSLEGETLSWQKAEGHEDEAVLWEPGASYKLQDITIKNSGNLALKYRILVTGIDGSAKLNEVIDWTVKVGDDTYDMNTELHLPALSDTDLTISGTMQTTAGNEYQGFSIDGVAITVYATQDTVEFDSTTNQYDKDAEYGAPLNAITTYDELLEKLADETVSVIDIGKDITLESALTLNRDVTINAYGNALTGNVITVTDGAKVELVNLKVKNIESEAAIVTVTQKSTLTLSDGAEISGNKSTGNIIYVSAGSQLIAKSGVKFNNNTTSKHLLFISRDSNRTYCSATLNNVEITGNIATGGEKFTGWSSSAGLIAASDNATLTINGGKITGNNVSYCTAGIITTRLGTVNLNGVTIKDNTATANGTACTCDKPTCISAHEVGSYNNVGFINISADCVLEGTNHGSGMGGYVSGSEYHSRDYWPAYPAARPAW